MSIALLAPDGAGKSTLAEGLLGALHFPTRHHYLGLEGGRFAGRGPGKVPGLGLVARLLFAWRTEILARVHRARGWMVVFDRHVLDARLAPLAAQGRQDRVRALLLGRSLPLPDLVVVLDAPTDALLARKQEHGRERIETDRTRYRNLAEQLPNAVVVDADRPADQVRRDVTELVWQIYLSRAPRAT